MGTFLRKLYTKNEQKLSGSFWEINILSEKLTTMDESALEKLRCLSAGGAKNCMEELLKHGQNTTGFTIFIIWPTKHQVSTFCYTFHDISVDRIYIHRLTIMFSGRNVFFQQ